MSDLLGLGSNGVLAYQRALVTVSNNIGNVATEGYSRQEVGLESVLPKPVGNDYIGTGVSVTQVRRQYDAFVENNLRGSLSNWVGQEPLVQYSNRVIDLMVGDQTSLTVAMTRFFEGARRILPDSFGEGAKTLGFRFKHPDDFLDDVHGPTKTLPVLK